MAGIEDQANSVFRDFVTDGVPASGPNDPDKANIRGLFSAVDLGIAAAQASITIVSTIADRDTFYATEANRSKLVYVNNNNGSATDPANGVYEYVNGAPRLAQAFYQGVATVVQPLVDEAEAAAAAAQNATIPLRPALSLPAQKINDTSTVLIGEGITTAGDVVDLAPQFARIGWSPVRPGGKVKINVAQSYGGSGFGIVWGNARQQRIAAVEGGWSAGQVFDVPAGVYWMDATVDTESLARLIVTDADYEGDKFPGDLESATIANSASGALAYSMVTTFGSSLIAGAVITSGSALDVDTGNVASFAAFSIVDVGIAPGVRVYVHGSPNAGAPFGYAMYDAQGARVQYRTTPASDGEILTPPPTARRLKMSVQNLSTSGFDLRAWGMAAPWADSGSQWKGRKMGWLGDSIMAHPRNWTGHVCDRLGAIQALRANRNGRTIAKALFRDDDVTPLTQSDFAGLDSVYIALITNDAGNQTPIGTISDPTTANTFYGHYKRVVTQIYAWEPRAKIILQSPLWRDLGTGTGFLDPYIAAQRDIARFYALELVDARYESGFSSLNYQQFYSDDTHPNESGYRLRYEPYAYGKLLAMAPVE